MPPPAEAQIQSFSNRPDVQKKALDLLYAVRATTGPGTGYDLAEGVLGLPAICAHIATLECGRVFLYLVDI